MVGWTEGLCIYVKSSTDINKPNNHLSPPKSLFTQNTHAISRWNLGPDLGHIQLSVRIKTVNGIATLSLLIIGSPTSMQI
jgi:hypothetical protein